ncbi:hypothetical protein Tco_1260567 [Tanacetum coccineum]
MKWFPKLMGFDYEVMYKKRSDNGAADALLRVQTPKLFSMLTTLVNTELAKKIEDSWTKDEKLHAIVTKLQDGKTSKKHYVWSNNQLTRKGKIVVVKISTIKKLTTVILPWRNCWGALRSQRYGYIRNHKKTVKNRQARTRERKSEQKPEAKPEKVNPPVNLGQQKSTKA